MPTKPQVFSGLATLTYVLRHCCFNTERPCQRDRCLHSTCSSTGPSRWTIVRFQSQSGSWKVFGNTERPSHRDRCLCSTCAQQHWAFKVDPNIRKWKVFGNTERPCQKDRCLHRICSNTRHSRWTSVRFH